MTVGKLIKKLETIKDKNAKIEFIYNGESDHMITYKGASIQYDNDENPYILLEQKTKS